MGKLHLNLSAYYEPIDSDPTLEEGTEMMNYYNDCVDKKVHPKEYQSGSFTNFSLQVFE